MAELKEQTIEKEFVPYEIALELKELGFKNNYNFKEYDTYGCLHLKGYYTNDLTFGDQCKSCGKNYPESE